MLKTGFSNNARALIPYLYKNQRYDIYHLKQGVGDDPQLQKFPWKNEGFIRRELLMKLDLTIHKMKVIEDTLLMEIVLLKILY